MTHLTDEQAIAKANSIEWFDNQAGMADFFTPKKKLTLSKPKQKSIDLEDMTVDQLQEQYVLAKDQLNVMKDVPKELREFVNDKSNKIYSYMLAIKIILGKKQGEEGKLPLSNFIKPKDDLEKKELEREIKSLKSKISILNNDLAQARLSNAGEKAKKRAERIGKATAREIMIHNKFKRLVKEYIGEDKYMTIIREADVLADAELNK